MRALETRGVPYRAVEYDDALTSAEGVANVLGVPAGEVYKTLVMRRDTGKVLLVMVPGGREVQPKVLAGAVGARAVRMVTKVEAERLTGLRTGGIGALALLGKPFEVYLDEAAAALGRIYVNGGRRGVSLHLAVADLVRVTAAVMVPAAPSDAATVSEHASEGDLYGGE